MAVTRRGYIFSAFLLSVFCVLLLLVAIFNDSWIVSSAWTQTQHADSSLRYGLFRGEIIINLLATPVFNSLYMTCVPDVNACAISCKTDAQARVDEVRALAVGQRPNDACVSETIIEQDNPLGFSAVISFGFYVTLLILLFLQLAFAVISAGLAILNATKNPTEPMFSLPGCLWSNVITAILGFTAMLTFGIYWATTNLQNHLAFSYVATGSFEVSPSIGYSYWLIFVVVICALANVGLIELRRYLLERDPPPPTIKLENHSDGTIFLY